MMLINHLLEKSFRLFLSPSVALFLKRKHKRKRKYLNLFRRCCALCCIVGSQDPQDMINDTLKPQKAVSQMRLNVLGGKDVAIVTACSMKSTHVGPQNGSGTGFEAIFTTNRSKPVTILRILSRKCLQACPKLFPFDHLAAPLLTRFLPSFVSNLLKNRFEQLADSFAFLAKALAVNRDLETPKWVTRCH